MKLSSVVHRLRGLDECSLLGEIQESSSANSISIPLLLAKNSVFLAVVIGGIYAFDSGFVISDRLSDDLIQQVDDARLIDDVISSSIIPILEASAPERIWSESFERSDLLLNGESGWEFYGDTRADEAYVENGNLVIEHGRHAWTGTVRNLSNLTPSRVYSLEAEFEINEKSWIIDVFLGDDVLAASRIGSGDPSPILITFETPPNIPADTSAFVRFVTYAADDPGSKLQISDLALITMDNNAVYYLLEGTNLNEVQKDGDHLVLDFGRSNWSGISVPINDYEPGGIYRVVFQGEQLNQPGFISIRYEGRGFQIGAAVVSRGEHYGNNSLVVPFAAPQSGEPLVINFTPMEASKTGGEMRIRSLTLDLVSN